MKTPLRGGWHPFCRCHASDTSHSLGLDWCASCGRYVSYNAYWLSKEFATDLRSDPLIVHEFVDAIKHLAHAVEE